MNRGSVWNIWDLHVHTPISFEQHYEGKDGLDVWESYITDLENLNPNIKVLGINDYFTIEGYKRVLEYKRSGRLQNIDLILPVIELRVDRFAGHEQLKRINYHIIFSNELQPEVIEREFINQLKTDGHFNPNDKSLKVTVTLNQDSIENFGKKIIESLPEDKRVEFGTPFAEGLKNLNFNIEDIENILDDNSTFKDKYLTAVGKTEWDAIRWDDSSIATKKSIVNRVNFLFTASENVERYNNARTRLVENAVNNRLLDCSDAHYNSWSEDKDRLGNCNNWIKSVLTFEGLRQAFFEFDSRVRIMEYSPDTKEDYQVIDTIKLNIPTKFSQTLLLNSNLNSIIGGRSTGKSTLLDCIAYKLCPQKIRNVSGFIQDLSKGVSVIWRDGTTDQREIQYYGQNELYEIAKDPHQVTSLINDILKAKGIAHAIEEYDSVKQNIESKISGQLSDLFQIRKELLETKKLIDQFGNVKLVEEQISKLTSRISVLQAQSGMTEDQLASYFKEVQEAAKRTKETEAVKHNIDLLISMQNIDPMQLSGEINNKITMLYQLGDKLETTIGEIREKVNDLWKIKLEAIIKVQKNRLVQLSQEEGKWQNSELYKQGKNSEERNAELKNLNRRKEEEMEKLLKIKKHIEQYNGLLNNYKEKSIQIITLHNELWKAINTMASQLVVQYDDIDIRAMITLDAKRIEETLSEMLNLRSTHAKEYVETFAKQYKNEPSQTLSTFMSECFKQKDLSFKGAWGTEATIRQIVGTQWYSYSYVISYEESDFNAMSPGKKAFVILKLLLDFSDKQCPILIDQPEDSLDNRAIYTDLVKYLKAKKEKRQIILVSHNANIVVGTDSENVIVANENGTNSWNPRNLQFYYVNGAIENTSAKNDNECILLSQGIREHICEILEGGREAFRERERKYGF